MKMNNNKQSALSFNRFFTGFILMILVVVTVLATTIKPDPIPHEPLSNAQQSRLANQLTLNGFKYMLKLKCYAAVVQRIQTGSWHNEWCQSKYSQLNFEELTQ